MVVRNSRYHLDGLWQTIAPVSEAPLSHSVSPDLHRIVADVITAIRSGDQARGRMLLAQALRIDPHHETAWLWMASLAETPEGQRERLERVLTISPNNEAAHRALRLLSEPHRQAVIPDQALHSLPTSALRQVQTATQAEGTSQDPVHHCPQCGAPIGTTDEVCAFCQSPVQSPSAFSAPSYPKRTPLTRGEQRNLTGRGLKRRGTSRLFNTTTIVGIVITGSAVAVILWTIQQNYLSVDDTGGTRRTDLSVLAATSSAVTVSRSGNCQSYPGVQMYRFA